MLDDLGGATSDLVKLALDVSTLRHSVLAHNVANANTQGFIPQTVGFEEYLSNAANSEPSRDGDRLLRTELEALRERLESGLTIKSRQGASVQLDMEIAEMAENVLRYQALLSGLANRGKIMKLAMSEGR